MTDLVSWLQLSETEQEEIWKEADTLQIYYDRGGNGSGLSWPSNPIQKMVSGVKNVLKERKS